MAKRSRRRDIIVGMYISAAVVMILTRLVSVVATMIDGIITSRFYGEEAYSAISLVTPYTKILVTCADMISIGCQLLYMDKLKQSGRDGARAHAGTAFEPHGHGGQPKEAGHGIRDPHVRAGHHLRSYERNAL